MKVFVGIICIIAIIAMARLGIPLLTAFDTGCNEDHHSVALMRSLSQEQLGALHARVAELSLERPGEKLFSSSEPFMPGDLAHLGALYISFNSADSTLMVLAKCTPSIGVNLSFQHSETGNNSIELQWPTPTQDNPYNSDSDILWNGRS